MFKKKNSGVVFFYFFFFFTSYDVCVEPHFVSIHLNASVLRTEEDITCRIRRWYCSSLSAVLLFWVFQVLLSNSTYLLCAAFLQTTTLACHSVPTTYHKPLQCSELHVYCCYLSSYLMYFLVVLLPMHSSISVNILDANDWQWDD